MFANRYTVLIDACSLVPALQRDILLHLAEAELFRVRWSDEALNETERTLSSKILPKFGYDDKVAVQKASDTIEKIKTAFPEAMVDDYEAQLCLADSFPDKNDAHIIAAAVKTRASMIVTENLKHFPADKLAALNIEAKTADDFIADAIDLDEGLAIGAISTMRRGYRKPEMDGEGLLSIMESRGLTSAASMLRPFVKSL